MLIQQFVHFCQQFLHFFSGLFSNAISSEVRGPIDFKFYVRHPGEGVFNLFLQDPLIKYATTVGKLLNKILFNKGNQDLLTTTHVVER